MFYIVLPSFLGVVIEFGEDEARVYPHEAVNTAKVSPHSERVVFARLAPLRFDVTAHCHKVPNTVLGDRSTNRSGICQDKNRK